MRKVTPSARQRRRRHRPPRQHQRLLVISYSGGAIRADASTAAASMTSQFDSPALRARNVPLVAVAAPTRRANVSADSNTDLFW